MSHTFEHRNYMIFNVSELGSVDFNEVLETSQDTVRKSIDETKTFVKWEGEKIPSSVASLITKQGPHNHNGMLKILSSTEWTSPEQEI